MSPPTKSEILDLGRTAYTHRVEQGDSQAGALTAALETVRAAERAACIAIAESWIPIAIHHQTVAADWVGRKIVQDLKGDA